MQYRIQQLKTTKGEILSMLRIVIHLDVGTFWSQALTRPKERESMRAASCPVIRKVRICRSGSNRTEHGTTDWFQIGKGVRQAVYCHLLI